MISLKNITKEYVSDDVVTKVLHGISFDVQDGEFVAIIGPSGSGKSTLMNILGLLDTPTTGSYMIDGKDVSTITSENQAKIRAEKIGFVFQSFNLLPRTTVLRNVMLPLIYRKTNIIGQKERVENVHKALKSAGFPEDRANNLSNHLSGGQIQRVAIARALVNNPVLILADEPTGNLDSKTSQIVLETFQELNQKEKRTIILITHEHDIAAYAKRVITLKDGLITEDKLNK